MGLMVGERLVFHYILLFTGWVFFPLCLYCLFQTKNNNFLKLKFLRTTLSQSFLTQVTASSSTAPSRGQALVPTQRALENRFSGKHRRTNSNSYKAKRKKVHPPAMLCSLPNKRLGVSWDPKAGRGSPA